MGVRNDHVRTILRVETAADVGVRLDQAIAHRLDDRIHDLGAGRVVKVHAWHAVVGNGERRKTRSNLVQRVIQ